MAKGKIPLRNMQITFRRSSPVVKILLVCTIVLFTVAMITLRWKQNEIQRQTSQMEQQAAQLIIDNEDLQEKIEDVDSVQGVQEIAQAELDMVFPDTEFFEP